MEYLISKENENTSYIVKEICHALYRNGHVMSSQGNVSYKKEDGTIIITPTGISLRDVSEENLSKVNIKGEGISGPTPSIELSTHLSVYKSRPDINCVIHTHPIDAIIFFNYFNSFKSDDLFKEYYKKSISIVQYFKPGSANLANAITKEAKKTEIIILKGHGLITMGKTSRESYNLTELIIHKSLLEIKNIIIGYILKSAP